MAPDETFQKVLLAMPNSTKWVSQRALMADVADDYSARAIETLGDLGSVEWKMLRGEVVVRLTAKGLRERAGIK